LRCTPLPPTSEVCNGIDDDCDGIVDDVTVTCGLGPCLRTGGCVRGQLICVPGAPGSVDLPGNDVDEDCDGSLGPCDPGLPWKSHGQFVQCVTREVHRLVHAGSITRKIGKQLVLAAAHSKIGRH
jgi:hypothetical protein